MTKIDYRKTLYEFQFKVRIISLINCTAFEKVITVLSDTNKNARKMVRGQLIKQFGFKLAKDIKITYLSRVEVF